MMKKYFFFLLVLVFSMVKAEQTIIPIQDVLGRTVMVKTPVNRVILGESRQLHLLAMLEPENFTKKIVAWKADLIQSDPATWQKYRKRFPALNNIPIFGGGEQEAFNLEQVITLKPDVIIMNMDARKAIVDAGYEQKLSKVGIPIVYIDFRYEPLKNIPRTVKIFGQLFQKSQIADEYIKFRETELRRVTSKIKQLKGPLPRVFLERLAGYSEECCLSFARGNFGYFVELAGGINLASQLFSNTFVTINPEKVIAMNPDIVILTSGNFQKLVPGGYWISLGPGADMKQARARLARFTTRPAYVGSTALKNGAFFAIWHQFYNSPYDVVAIQQLAKWIHPQLFTDLDPDDTFKRIHEKFLPVPYQSGYAVDLKE